MGWDSSSHHVDRNVFIQTFELGDVADGLWKLQTGRNKFGQMGSTVAHARRISFGFDAVDMC